MSRRARGFLFADALIGLALVVMIAVALVSAKSAYARFERRAADQRQADRLAEEKLVRLQTDQAFSPDPAARVIELKETAAPQGWRWVTIEQSYKDRVGRISGLVRAEGAR